MTHTDTTGRRPAARRRGVVTALAASALAAPMVFAATAAPAAADEVDCSTVAWMDTSLSAEERAAALLDASSQHQIYRWLVEQPANDPTATEWRAGFNGEDPIVYPEQVPCTPWVVYTDGPDGIRFQDGVTAFPATLGVAATWNLDLAEEKGDAQGAEAFDKQKSVILAPGLASGRTPLSGRTPEYLGEDPVLTGLMTAAGVRGIEDRDDGRVVLSTPKHYVANEQETSRSTSSSNMDERTFRQIYDLPFAIAVDRGEPASVMCSYNQVNGVYTCEHPDLLEVALKADAGFAGYVMSDFGSVHSTAESLMGGLDQELNRPRWFSPARLDAALAAGDITQERIEEAATRVIVSYIEGGLFDTPLPDEPVADASTDAHKAIARTIAEQGSVLLANDGVLPLAAEAGETIALIGPTASLDANEDGVSAATVCSLPWRFGSAGTLTCEDLVSPETAITERAAADGVDVTFEDGDDLEAAAAAAAAADVAIVFGYQSMGEFSDIADLALQGDGDALVSTVAAANANTVVVLNTGSAVEMPWIDEVSAVLEGWYGGEQWGPALAGLLFGDVSPTGKLPMTFPVSLADTPTAGSEEQYPGVLDEFGIRQVDYSEGLEVGYRWYEAQDIAPLFEFGHGLSYTEFSYDQVTVTPKSTTGDQEIRVRFKLTNTGDVAGTEVAQVYLELPDATGEPSKRLIGWERVTLEPGQHRNVQVTLSAEDLADLHLLEYWDTAAGDWSTAPGTYVVTVGGSVSADAAASFTIR
ncbi:beta-glucosidase [Agromyces sp. SYSU T00194]|uniref:beta-glucosidase n=1 Tax=Agromyces chitinivorans TaxID=3158560 RepID=UPI003399F992